jgi:hypothetical protein
MQSDIELALTLQSRELTDKMEAQQTNVLSELEYDIKITRTIEYLSRANLYLSQSNYGLAKQDILAAYSVLNTYQKTAPMDTSDFLQMVIGRLEMALNNLPAYPVVASNDLQIAWQYLADGGNAVENITIPVFTATPTPTVEVTTQSTPLPTPTGPVITLTPTNN